MAVLMAEDMDPKITLNLTWKELELIFDGIPWTGVVSFAKDRKDRVKDIRVTVSSEEPKVR